jgi:hypothetical protein
MDFLAPLAALRFQFPTLVTSTRITQMTQAARRYFARCFYALREES